MTEQLPRGIRNNNPGNLRESPGDKTTWVGERSTNDDPIFEEFESPVFGIRALALVLLNYQRKHGLNNVEQIINRWAPPSENNTKAYAKRVANALGVGLRQPLDLRQQSTLIALTRAIIRNENGPGPSNIGDWYDLETYLSAIDMALK